MKKKRKNTKATGTKRTKYNSIDTMYLDRFVALPQRQDKFIRYLGYKLTGRSLKTMRCVLYHALVAGEGVNLWVSYSRDDTKYYGRYFRSPTCFYPEVKEIVDLLGRDGWLDRKKGYFNSKNKKAVDANKRSQFCPTTKLVSAWASFCGGRRLPILSVPSGQREVLELKRPTSKHYRGGRLVKYAETKRSKRLRTQIRRINSQQGRHEWSLRVPSVLITDCMSTRSSHVQLWDEEKQQIVTHHLPDAYLSYGEKGRLVKNSNTDLEDLLCRERELQVYGQLRTDRYTYGPSRHLSSDEWLRSILRRNDSVFQINLNAPRYKRVFHDLPNHNWDAHGRWYCGLQQIPSALRPFLYVDGQPTVEIDFKATHPSMLYALAGKAIPPGDIYHVNALPHLPRALWKFVFMALLNSKSPRSAYSAIYNQGNRTVDRFCYAFTEREPNAYWACEELRGGLKAKAIAKAFEKQHPDIVQFLYKKYCYRLMYQDSEITNLILRNLGAAKLPCLAVHDSFVVPATEEARLRNLMVATWRKQLGNTPRVKTLRGHVLGVQVQLPPGTMNTATKHLGAASWLRGTALRGAANSNAVQGAA